MTRTYSELIKLDTFEERFRYLKLDGKVGEETFGWDRYLNQVFYKFNEDWKKVRREVIVRDHGCDLAINDREIFGKIFVHHMNPIVVEDLSYSNREILNPEFLITTSFLTHNAIHYSNENVLITLPAERAINDTCPWRK